MQTMVRELGLHDALATGHSPITAYLRAHSYRCLAASLSNASLTASLVPGVCHAGCMSCH